MAYFFTLLYLLTAYLTPRILFGPLAEFHIEIIVVLLAIVTSIPNLSGSGLGRAPQTIALAGLAFSIAASIAQTGWLGGVLGPLYSFTQPAFAFFLVAMNFRRKSHFVWLIVLLIAGSIFFMVMGSIDLHNGVYPSAYLYGDEGFVRRLRGLGVVNDPNDFAQMLIALIPCIFLWWKKSIILNIFLCGIPLLVLLVGTYLTHSRGAIIALTVVVLLAARRTIGTVPAAIIAGTFAVGLFSIGWSGGRDISMNAGADRLDLWYDGMQSLKSRPLFGIGLDGFRSVYGITAHNSVIICAAELGTVGLFFWIFLLFSTARDAIRLGDPTPDTRRNLDHEDAPYDWLAPANDPAISSLGSATQTLSALDGVHAPQSLNHQFSITEPESDVYLISTGETVRIARILLISLAGMLAAGWFLSRSLSMWLFMYCGMIYAVSEMNWAATSAPKDKLGYLMRWSAIITVLAIASISIILRFRNFG